MTRGQAYQKCKVKYENLQRKLWSLVQKEYAKNNYARIGKLVKVIMDINHTLEKMHEKALQEGEEIKRKYRHRRYKSCGDCKHYNGDLCTQFGFLTSHIYVCDCYEKK